MKILLIGGNGTIGKKVSERLADKNEVIIAGKHKGDVIVDIEDPGSIKNMFKTIGSVDAIVCVAGEAKWDTFDNLTEEDFYIGIKNKLMGQVNLVKIGKEFLNKQGSITLTSGVLADEPVYMTTSAAMVNGALHSFVKAVTLELDGIRINVVCSDLVEDSFKKYQDYFPGHTPVPMNKVVDAYIKSIAGKLRGEIIRVKS
jgi:NAD(P)-dependent dehydrogenase (short-subunit alcohol dehydrogenase family)